MTPMSSARQRTPLIARRRARRAGRHGRGDDSGVGLVEFALVAPVAFLLLCSIVIFGIVITNFIQLSNLARDGARVAAICGSKVGAPMPDGSGACSGLAISTYITSHLVAVPSGSVTPQIYVCSSAEASTCSSSDSTCSLISPVCQCQQGRTVEVDMSYDQPLYFPVLTTVLQSSPNGTRHLSASAQATCEQ
jgi:Flp pilus assembly protein TadG